MTYPPFICQHRPKSVHQLLERAEMETAARMHVSATKTRPPSHTRVVVIVDMPDIKAPPHFIQLSCYYLYADPIGNRVFNFIKTETPT